MDGLISCVETKFLREPVLLIIDSYSCHIKLANSKELENCNIHIVIVLPNLINILQPLDVAFNRSFQAYYQTLYDTYIDKAIDDQDLQTKATHLKTPSCLMLSKWVVKWINTKLLSQIMNAFKVCGLLPRKVFKLDDLHPLLKALFLPSFDINIWKKLYSSEFIV